RGTPAEVSAAGGGGAARRSSAGRCREAPAPAASRVLSRGCGGGPRRPAPRAPVSRRARSGRARVERERAGGGLRVARRTPADRAAARGPRRRAASGGAAACRRRPAPPSLLRGEQDVEPDGQTRRQVADLLEREQHACRERLAVERVVADRQQLA